MRYCNSLAEVVLVKYIKGKSINLKIFSFHKASGEIVAIKMIDLESE